MPEAEASRRRERPRRPHVVAGAEEIPPGGRKIVDVEGRSIGVFNVAGSYYAVRNLCPHQQAPLCEGRVMGTTLPSRPGEYHLGLQGQVLRCPWHAWEFDLSTGRSVFDPRGCRVRSYEVALTEAALTDEAALTEGAPAQQGAGGALQVETFPARVEGRFVVVLV